MMLLGGSEKLVGSLTWLTKLPGKNIWTFICSCGEKIGQVVLKGERSTFIHLWRVFI